MKTMTRASTGEVIGGVDTHKDVHVAAVIDSIGRTQGVESFPTTVHGYRRLLAWLQSYGELLAVGVEGCGSWGAVSHPGFDAVLVPWLSGPEKETVDHGSSPEVLR